MKHIQAGVSKRTGNQFDAFDVCDEQQGGCGFKQFGQRQNGGQQRNNQQRPQQRPQNGNAAPSRRDALIYAQCAVKSACEFYVGRDVPTMSVFTLAQQFFLAFQRVERGGVLTFPAVQQTEPADYDDGPPIEDEAPYGGR